MKWYFLKILGILSAAKTINIYVVDRNCYLSRLYCNKIKGMTRKMGELDKD